jgi:hypothetical protein
MMDSKEAPMGLIFRKRFRFGPFRFNFTENGYSSWSLKLGRWSWNSRTRAHRVDLPGPASWTSKKSR